MMARLRDETPAQQRQRILLSSPETETWVYDLAVALGYAPESWDGMWRLLPNPFTVLGPFVLVREARVDRRGSAIFDRAYRQRTRYRLRLLP